MFEKAEIVLVCSTGSGPLRAAEGVMRARLEYVGMADQYGLHLSTLSAGFDRPVPGTECSRFGSGFGVDSPTQPLTQEMVGEADLILVMDEGERKAIRQEFAGGHGKIFLLNEIAERPLGSLPGGPSPREKVFDPQYRDTEALVRAGFWSILQRANSVRDATMARVGLSTVIFINELAGPSLPETLALFRRAGIRFVDWCIDDITSVYTRAEMDHFAELQEAHDLRCELVHGVENPEVHAVSEGEDLDRYVAVQSNVIEFCAHLGGDTVVVHLPGLNWRNSEMSFIKAMEQTTVALDRLRPLCEKLGVALAVENMPYSWQPDTQMREFYFGRYPETFMGFCLDVGHANIGTPLCMEKLRTHSSRLRAVHLHDNRGKEDDHQPPFFGTIDWSGLFGWLHEIGYTRSLNFELGLVRSFFAGGPAEFVDHATRRIRRAVSLVPEPIQQKLG